MRSGHTRALKRIAGHLVDPKVKEHHGRIVKTTGDGMLVEFPSVVDAVRCAIEVQRAMIERNADIADDKRIAFRIGVNLGDVIAEGGDIYGDGVNVAARLEALAEPGGICISGMVWDHIRDKLPYGFEDMGEQSVKNIARPVRVFAMSPAAIASLPVVWALPQTSSERSGVSTKTLLIAACAIAVVGVAAAGVWRQWPYQTSPTLALQAPTVTPSSSAATGIASAAASRLSIVVLPFTNLSNEPGRNISLMPSRMI
jgi:hypothetical protein